MSFLTRAVVDMKQKKANSVDDESFSDDILKGKHGDQGSML
jgi:hypothetical protein